MRESPCKNCTKRRLGCHSPDVCAEWGVFVAESEAIYEARRKQSEIHAYLSEKSRKIEKIKKNKREVE
jgi:hypothetical protein